MKYRIGLDVGTNSLGWSVLELDNKGEVIGIKVAGSRIFSDGRRTTATASTTLAAERREARSARRRRDRYIQRRTHLSNALTEAGLFPKDTAIRQALQKLNPLELRARLLAESAADVLADIKTRTHKSKYTEINGEPTADAIAASRADMQPQYLIGRALFHLNQRRGFRSNRKERTNETTTKIDTAINDTQQQMINGDMQTFGQLLWSLNKNHEPSRARARAKSGAIVDSNGQVDHYDRYASRRMLKDEFNKIWDAQAKNFSQQMADKENFRTIIFDQRPLKAPHPGMCMYMNDEPRGAKALPSIQYHRIYQELNNLAWGEDKKKIRLRDCSKAYAKIEAMLLQPTNKSGEVTFNKMRGALKKLGVMQIPEGLTEEEEPKEHLRFNLERGTGKKNKRKKPQAEGQKKPEVDRKHLNGDKTAALLGGDDSPVQEQWRAWDNQERDAFVLTIIERVPDEKRLKQERYKTDEEAIDALQDKYGLSKQEARTCVHFNFESGYADLSTKAANLITEYMKGENKPTQREAVQEVAQNYSDGSFKDPYELVGKGEQEELAYYGAVPELAPHIIPGSNDEKDSWNDRKYHGGVTNPTVHIALNQIRQVVNQIIIEQGRKPESISIELGRNLPVGGKKRLEIRKRQAEQQVANKADKITLRRDFNVENPRRDDIRKLRLWREAEKRCPFCCQPICITKFNDAEIEHLIPKASGGQDNWSNLTIACRDCNRTKRDQTPYEAFGDNPDYSMLPEFKHWRFQEDAREKWGQRKGFSERHLNDTRYIGRIAKAYLGSICADKNITVVTGQLTHHLRKYWHLDSILDDPNRPEEERGTKNRNDHRHHAIDAIVVGHVSRSLVQKVSTSKERFGKVLPMEKLVERLVNHSKEERENLLKEVKKIVDNITVSHKVKRKKPLYMTAEQTVTTDRSKAKLDKKGRPIKISTDGQFLKDTAYGGSAFTKENNSQEADFKEPIDVFHKGKREKIKVIPIKDKKSGQIYKSYKPGLNWGMEIFQYPDKYPENAPKMKESCSSEEKRKWEQEYGWKRNRGKWKGFTITKFEANQPEFDPDNIGDRKPCPGAKFIMRLQIDDLVDIGAEESPQIMRVKELSGQNIILVPHNEADADARNRNKDITGTYNGHDFSGELTGKQNTKFITFKPETGVSGTYQGQIFAGKVQKPRGSQQKKVIFNLNGDEKKLDLDAPDLDWKYDDDIFRDLADTSNAWQYDKAKDEFKIEANAVGLKWHLDDKFEIKNISAGKLKSLNARKVHISPTGQVNYEKRGKKRKRRQEG